MSGKQFLLTATAGEATHLTRETDSEEDGQAAVPDHYVDEFDQTYEMAAILDPQWEGNTLCGRQRILMEGDRDGEEGEAGDTPSCRRCLDKEYIASTPASARHQVSGEPADRRLSSISRPGSQA